MPARLHIYWVRAVCFTPFTVPALSAAGLEPKRLRPVAADAGRAPSLVLVESVRGAAEGMVYEKNLVLYRDPAHTQYTEELERIYHAFS